MKYLLIFTSRFIEPRNESVDYEIYDRLDTFESGCIHVDYEDYDNFEEIMIRFTHLSSLDSVFNVLVIEKNTKKVVCYHECEGQGHTTFNRYLLDAMIYDNDDDEEKNIRRKK